MKSPLFIVIDLFCGFGGTTHGYTKAKLFEIAVALVIACVNHDWKAIQSHWKNHRKVEHFNEDITKLYGQVIVGVLLKSPEFVRLSRLVDLYRAFYPDAKLSYGLPWNVPTLVMPKADSHGMRTPEL